MHAKRIHTYLQTYIHAYITLYDVALHSIALLHITLHPLPFHYIHI